MRGLSLAVPFASSALGPPSGPTMARIIETPKEARDSAWIVHVIYQALGFSGAVVLITAFVGLLVAGALMWARARRMPDAPSSITDFGRAR